MRSKLAAAAALVAVLAVPPVALAVPPPPGGDGVKTGWAPNNAGIMWWQSPEGFSAFPRQPPGEPSGAWWLTRRIVASPLRPGVVHLGSFLHGIYASVGGGSWVSLTPACWMPLDSPFGGDPLYGAVRQVAMEASGMDACGVEGLAYDRILPNRIYASAYDVTSLSGANPTLGPGGVYVSDDLGAHWRKLLGGIRGAGLAVHRTGLLSRIVVGYIQASNTSVGSTPGGASVSISDDDGLSWRHVAFPGGCADTVASSPRLTANVVINPATPDRIYVGTNSGLYASSNGGQSFTLARLVCGGVWGIAVTPDGSRVYVGDHNGQVAVADATTLAFSPVTSFGSGVMSLALDPRDPDARTLYAAVWSGGAAGVWRVAANGAKTALADSVLTGVDQFLGGFPKPFPLVFRGADGTAPSLFLAQLPPRSNLLYASTIFRGVFLRRD